MLQPLVVDKPALTVVGFEAAFIHALSPHATNFKVIGPLWDKFIGQAAQVPNKAGHEMYGVIRARPEAQRAHPHELQYLAGVFVSKADVPEGMVCWTIPPGTFAVFTHRGPITSIGETVHHIYRVWLPQSAYRHAQIADVELYDHRFCCSSTESEMEYWISVTEKVR